MTALTTVIVLAIWAGIGALIYEPIESANDLRCDEYNKATLDVCKNEQENT